MSVKHKNIEELVQLQIKKRQELITKYFSCKGLAMIVERNSAYFQKKMPQKKD